MTSCLDKPNCPSTLVCNSPGYSGISGLTLDTFNNKAYFSDFSNRAIYAVDLLDPKPVPLLVTRTDLTPLGVTLDVQNNVLFYVEQGTI